jgi:methionyl-tRNA formyltransferase
MKIVYIGTVDFSYHCLCEVLESQGNVVGIITSKNNRANSDYCDLTPISSRYGIPIHYCKNVNDTETIKWIEDREPDIIFCWGWSQLIKTELLSLPPMGIVGVHPALLPKNRGRHPLIWALVLGLKESGLTFFFMDEGADSGAIVSQKRFEITKEDTANTLYKKIEELAKIQIEEFLPNLISGDYSTIIQDSENANYWRKRSAKDGMIDWRMNRAAILNLIRALTKPYPGASFNYKEQIITVWKAREYDQETFSNIEPGKIFLTSNGAPVIKCYDGAVVIDKYEPNTKFIEGEYIK